MSCFGRSSRFRRRKGPAATGDAAVRAPAPAILWFGRRRDRRQEEGVPRPLALLLLPQAGTHTDPPALFPNAFFFFFHHLSRRWYLVIKHMFTNGRVNATMCRRSRKRTPSIEALPNYYAVHACSCRTCTYCFKEASCMAYENRTRLYSEQSSGIPH